MQNCPYCNAELNRPTHRLTSRADTNPGQKRSGQELIACPDCGEVIDGFRSH